MPYKYRLKCPCPCEGCEERNEVITWVHACDSGEEYMDENGYVKCMSCQSVRLLIDLRFNCGYHKNNEYLEISYHRLGFILNVIGKMYGIDEDDVDSIYDTLKKEYKRKKGKK